MKDPYLYLASLFLIAAVMVAALTTLHGCACEFGLVDFGPVIK